VPDDLAAALLEHSKRSGKGIERFVIELLHSQLRLMAGPPFHDLDDLAGTWTEEEAAEFDQILEGLRRIDPELWE
jgi:hypothetical protein